MPTNANAYNSRLTDEALEKRFRDTFRSQGGAELVDDLYASGVIVPVVDFTQAAEGSQLPQNLQNAWDFSTGQDQVNNTTTNLISTAGFWLVDLTVTTILTNAASVLNLGRIEINDGASSKQVWAISTFVSGTQQRATAVEQQFVVYLRSGDTLRAVSTSVFTTIDVWYRQIATANGDLVNPTGFTSS